MPDRGGRLPVGYPEWRERCSAVAGWTTVGLEQRDGERGVQRIDAHSEPGQARRQRVVAVHPQAEQLEAVRLGQLGQAPGGEDAHVRLADVGVRAAAAGVERV